MKTRLTGSTLERLLAGRVQHFLGNFSWEVWILIILYSRRFGISKKFKPCKLENKCTFRKNGYFSCKKCRMQRCLQFGMTIDSELQNFRNFKIYIFFLDFQFDREPIYRKDLEIPQVIEMFSAICLNSFSDSWHIFWKAQLNTFQCSIGLQQLQTLSWCSISCR